ncbi:MAG TPA: transcriptional repressor LexA [Armatimonadota bacterium]
MHAYISDLQAGDVVDSIFGVRSIDRKTTQQGKPYARLTLCDKSGSIPAHKWDLTDPAWAALEKAEYLHVTGKVEVYKGDRQIALDGAARVARPDDVSHLIPTCPGRRDDHWTAYGRFARRIRDPYLKQLMAGVFRAREFRQSFRDASAAVAMHHAYAGGLLEHTVQVAGLCMAVCDEMPELRRDLLLAGALLHDIGKVQEIDISNPAFGFTMDGGLVGHVTIGAGIVDREIAAIPGFPPSLRAAVLHLILAHQGTSEWGALVVPAIPEAFVLHACDNVSAKIHVFDAARSQAGAGLFAYHKALNGRVFLGDVELCETPEAPGSSPAWLVDDGEAERPTLRILAGGRLDAMDLPEMAALPILGRIAAGAPIDAERHTEGYVAMPVSGRGDERDFLLRVSGDSMRDAHILDGDLVRVRPQINAADGEIVAALLNGDVTVKRLLHQGDALVLHPENPGFDDIPVEPNTDFHIQGIVVGLLRQRT